MAIAQALAVVGFLNSSDGGAGRWATVYSLITTAKLNDVEPFAYLKMCSSACPMAIS
ncbi:MAG: hypothetical protein AB7O56_06085 [Bauldia sp.]